jgi:cell surface protein SprA
MPLNSSLIRGLKVCLEKTQLQFGKTTVTGVFSQNHKPRVVSQGGGTLQDFEMFALDYDNDRHFFYRNILEINMIRHCETILL